jgi:hypothetical protein
MSDRTLLDQIKQAVREVLAESELHCSWCNADPGYIHLGLDSAEQLRIMVRTGVLRVGIEVRDVRSRDSRLPRYQFHIAKCEARLLEPPAKRQLLPRIRGRPKKGVSPNK